MKHAYLIIAHNQFKLLKELLDMLNDKDNDLFVHLDKKADIDEFRTVVDSSQYNDLFVIQKHNVTWGGHSQIECELTLLKAALARKKDYDYLHIISGVDLPIKSKDYIRNFFESNKGKEFLYFDTVQDMKNIMSRCNEYHLFQEILGRKETGILANVERLLISLQKKLRISRTKPIQQYLGKGANWVSITANFAEYVIKNESLIKKYFWHSRCADEVFMHTLFNMSPFKENLYIPEKEENIKYTNMVFADWNRGNPYVFKNEDIPGLVALPYLYARKFDENISINKLKELIR